MTGSSDMILSIHNVSKSFPGVKALDNVSMDVRRGVVHGIVGENGAGKSTLMKILSGVYTKDSGEVVFDGRLVEKTTPIDALRSGLSIIYQEFSLVNSMTVGENIFLGRFAEAGGMKKTHQKAKKLLESIGSTIDTYRYVSELSTSEKQMVEITKALSFDSKLIIMDEPSSSLTDDELKRLGVIIRELKQRGISIIYISHKLDEIFEYCDMVTIMRDGHVIDTRPAAELTRSDMIAMMVGRSIESEYPERPRCVGEPLLEVRHLNSSKLHDISFTLHKGEILGFAGLVGAGRTETMRLVCGADPMDAGVIRVNGKEAKIRSPKDAVRYGIGYLSEDRKRYGLCLNLSVTDNTVLPSLEQLFRGPFVNDGKADRHAQDYVDKIRTKTPNTRARVGSLSGGNQQKVVISKWLLRDCDVLIFDEPTRGIDVGAKSEIYKLMTQLAEEGKAIIMISSDMPELLRLSDRVIVMCEGHVTGELDISEATQESIMTYATKREEG